MGVVFLERERERELTWRLHNTGSLSRLGVHSVPESEEKEELIHNGGTTMYSVAGRA